MNRTDFEEWPERYRSAWKTDDPQQIGDPFTEDASSHRTAASVVRRVVGREADVAAIAP